MAGHSKWANIQHRKGRQDKLRSKLFSKLFSRDLLDAFFRKLAQLKWSVGGANQSVYVKIKVTHECADFTIFTFIN